MGTKTWNSDGDPCEACQALDGTTVGEDDEFDAGWAMIDGPDGNHPHCECDLTFEDAPDDGALADALSSAEQLAGQITGTSGAQTATEAYAPVIAAQVLDKSVPLSVAVTAAAVAHQRAARRKHYAAALARHRR